MTPKLPTRMKIDKSFKLHKYVRMSAMKMAQYVVEKCSKDG